MKGITNVVAEDQLKSVFVETLLNHTNEVSKISDFSVLNGIAYGFAKLFRKLIKDTAIVESKIIPELSYGSFLDDAAKNFGVSSRLNSIGSSTYVLVNSDPGTIYVPGVSRFNSTQGVIFDITEVSVVNAEGYAYIPVYSASSGLNTNVSAFTINTCINAPIGHISCTNEYAATGGRDIESDKEFKNRISKHESTVSISTLDKLLAELQKIDTSVYTLKKMGSYNGKTHIGVLSCNGRNYTSFDLTSLLNSVLNKLSISDLNNQFGEKSFEFVNVEWQQVGGSSGIDFRVKLNGDESTIRKAIQINLTKYFDFKGFNKEKIEWEDLFIIIKNTEGVEYLPEEYFYPKVDETVGLYSFPRVVKFIMRDLYGEILYNNDSNILPVYYS